MDANLGWRGIARSPPPHPRGYGCQVTARESIRPRGPFFPLGPHAYLAPGLSMRRGWEKRIVSVPSPATAYRVLAVFQLSESPSSPTEVPASPHQVFSLERTGAAEPLRFTGRLLLTRCPSPVPGRSNPTVSIYQVATGGWVLQISIHRPGSRGGDHPHAIMFASFEDLYTFLNRSRLDPEAIELARAVVIEAATLDPGLALPEGYSWDLA